MSTDVLPSAETNAGPPEDWQQLPLSALAEIRFSGVNKVAQPSEEPVRLCNYINVYNNDYITADMDFMRATATRSEIEQFGLRAGDVIITKDSETPDDIGVPAVVDSAAPDIVCGYHLALIRPNQDAVNPTFLAKQLGHYRLLRYFGRQANGSTRYGLSTAAISRAPLWLPKRGEQQAAGQILRLVDTAIAKMEAVIAKLRQVRAGLLHDLLTRGLDDSGQLRDPVAHSEQFTDSPVGAIPKNWDVSTVGAEFDLTTGFTLGPHRRPGYYRHKYLRVANVQRGHIILDELAELGATPDEVKDRLLLEDDLLIVEGHADPGEIGRCARVPPQAAGLTFQNHLFRLRPIRANPVFAETWLNSHYARRYWNGHCSTSSGLNTINQTALRNMRIIACDRSEQDRIASVIFACDRLISHDSDELAKLASISRGLNHDLLTGRVYVPTAAEVSI